MFDTMQLKIFSFSCSTQFISQEKNHCVKQEATMPPPRKVHRCHQLFICRLHFMGPSVLKFPCWLSFWISTRNRHRILHSSVRKNYWLVHQILHCHVRRAWMNTPPTPYWNEVAFDSVHRFVRLVIRRPKEVLSGSAFGLRKAPLTGDSVRVILEYNYMPFFYRKN